jgi:hypothetical protein
MKVIISLAAAYIMAFIITYGHAYSMMESPWVGENVVGAFLSSLFWPLYWSVQLWK